MNALLCGASLQDYQLRNGSIYSRRGKVPQNRDTIIQKLMLESGSSRDDAISSLDVWIARETAHEKLIGEMRSKHCPETVLQGIMESESIIYCGETGCFYSVEDGRRIRLDRSDIEVLILMKMDGYQRILAEKGLRPFLKDRLMAAIISLEKENAKKMVRSMLERLAYRSDCEAEADGVLDEIIRLWEIQGDHLVIKTVLKHWIWLTKRRMQDMTVRWEMMVVLHGGQGACKSTLAKRMMTCVGDRMTTLITFDQILDINREIRKLSESFIMLLDDLDSFSEDSIGSLKSILSMETVKIRTLGSQEQSDIRIHATPIATCNRPIWEIIGDESGMRRFFQLEIGLKDAFDKPGIFDEMEALYEKLPLLWNGVDENRELGYLIQGSDVFRNVNEIQNGYRKRTSLDMFLDDMGYVFSPCVCDKITWIPLTTVLMDYKQWCQNIGWKNPISPMKVGGYIKQKTIFKSPKNRVEFGFLREHDPVVGEDGRKMML